MMKELLEEIDKKFKIYHGNGVSNDEIDNAEKELALSFSEEYKEYLREIGCMSFASHEFTGLGFSGYLNVVEATKSERNLDDRFPKNCILIENVGIDGLLILHDKTGAVYSYVNGNKAKIADSFYDFLRNVHE